MTRSPLLLLSLLMAMPAAPLLADTPVAGTKLDLSATAEVSRAPDRATVSAGVVTQAATARAALADNARAMTAAIAALKRAGVAAADIQTASIRLNPQFRYADNQPPQLTGYQATNQVNVRLRDLARTGDVIDALVSAGANQIDGPSFEVSDADAALDEARTAALAKARARAALYARAAGLHVGRILSIDEQSSAPPVIRPMAMMAAKRDATPIEPGEQTLSVTLQVSFELD